jgi:DNA-binding transcriptional LysR family regulator
MPTDLLALSGISLDRLQNFCLVEEKGGIARAVGDDLSRQALVSRQIRELEEFFGVELTRRRGKGIEVTEAGRDLARLARTTFEGLGDFKTRAAGEPVTIRFAAGNSVVEWFLIPRIKKLGKALVDVRVELFDMRTTETVRAIVEHTIDIGVVRRSAVSAPLKFRMAAEVGYRLFVPRSMVRRERDVAALPLALALGGEFYTEAMKLAGKARVELNARWRCASFTQAARLVEQGVCAAILPEIATEFLGDTATAMEVPWLNSYRRKIGFVWHQRLADARPAVAKVVDLLVAG